MAGVPGTASAIFGTVKDVGASVVMISQVRTSLHPMCQGCEIVSTGVVTMTNCLQPVGPLKLPPIWLLYSLSITAS